MASNRQLPNFVDLRKSKPKGTQLIQDVSHPRLKRRWRHSFYRTKQLSRGQLTMAVFVLVILAAIGSWALVPTPSPLPASIKQQVNFVVLYPSNYRIGVNSWQYQNSQQTLTFTASNNNVSGNVVFTEQKTPLAFQNDLVAYSRFIGSLRPSANFNSPLGPVSLAQFVTAGDFQTQGQSGILNAKGTLLIAHPSNNLSGDQWHSLFNSLKASN